MSIAGRVLFVSLAVGCFSCISFHGPKDLRRDLVDVTGVELEQESGVSVGRMGVMLARWFTDEDEVPLKGVRRVQVGVYTVTDFGERGYGDVEAALGELPGWQPVVRVRERDEIVHVMLREEREAIRGMLVVVMERDEWVLVRVKGRLDHMVEKAMQMAFDQADRPELYEPAVARYREERGRASADEETRAG